MEEIIRSNSNKTTIYIGRAESSTDFLLEAKQLYLGRSHSSTVYKTLDGAPYYSDDYPKVSLSHKDDLYVAALSTTDIGVDIEKIKVFDYQKIAQRFFQQSFTTARDFFIYWTGREALSKKHGKGLFPLRDYVGQLSYYEYGDYLIALAE